MKRAILAVSARPSEAGEDGAEIIAASPDSGFFGPIRRGPMLLTRISVAGQTQKSECATGKSALPSTTVIVSQTCQVRKVPIPVSASMPGQDPRSCSRSGRLTARRP
jgi:hypothetical protein